MILAFLESIKYVGHLVPVAFLRIFVGTLYLQSAIQKFNTDFIIKSKVVQEIQDQWPQLQVAPWYQSLVETALTNHWQIVGFGWMSLEFAIGISYLLGYVVRPIALLASFLCLQFLILQIAPGDAWYRLLLVVHLTFAWLGAGRCLGLDSYFYKRQRGWWW